jgi:hypothetical protein
MDCGVEEVVEIANVRGYRYYMARWQIGWKTIMSMWYSKESINAIWEVYLPKAVVFEWFHRHGVQISKWNRVDTVLTPVQRRVGTELQSIWHQVELCDLDSKSNRAFADEDQLQYHVLSIMLKAVGSLLPLQRLVTQEMKKNVHSCFTLNVRVRICIHTAYVCAIMRCRQPSIRGCNRPNITIGLSVPVGPALADRPVSACSPFQCPSASEEPRPTAYTLSRHANSMQY